jgi:carbon monoxide dehydrogenase subunit G
MILNFKVYKPINVIFSYLTDMQKFVSVHPIITKMDDLGNNHYRVYETLKIGFIPISFTYSAKIDSNFEDKTVIIQATVMKFTKINMTFSLKTKAGFSEIEEIIQFTSPFPIKNIMQNIFRKQHTQLFKNIEQA